MLVVGVINLNIGYVDNLPFEDRATCEEGRRWRGRIYRVKALAGFGRVVVVCDHVHQIPIKLIERAQQRTAQPYSTPDDGVEDGVEVCRRTADDVEHFARSCLMIKSFDECVSSFCYLACARLLRLEKPCVLDGDHGLVGKRLDKCDLLCSEGSDFGSPDLNVTDCLTLAQKWNAKRGPMSKPPGKRTTRRKFYLFGLKVCDVNQTALNYGAPP